MAIGKQSMRYACFHIRDAFLPVVWLLAWLSVSENPSRCAAAPLADGFHLSRHNDHLSIVGVVGGARVFDANLRLLQADDRATLPSQVDEIFMRRPSSMAVEFSIEGNNLILLAEGTANGTDLMPCTPERIEGRIDIVRGVSGLSQSQLNTGVYCRDGDWAITVVANDVRVQPANGRETGLTCKLESSGKSLRFEILPDFYRKHRGLNYFNPHEYTLPARVPSGWISWKAYKGSVAQEHIEQTTDWAVTNLRDFGLEYLIIDDGWFIGSNRGMLHSVPSDVDWTRSNDGFPAGMQHLTRYVHDRGLKIGLWLTPFGCSNLQLQDDYPDWWVHHSAGGEILQSSWHGKAFVDASNPEAVSQWLVKGIRAQAFAGFDYFKIDGQKHVAYDAYEKSGDYFLQKRLTWQEALRQGWSAIRRAAGDRYVLACWGRVPEIAGYPLAIRIGNDKDSSWKSIVGVATDLANWYYEHNIVWCVDPDHLVFRDLGLEECRTWATLLGLTGTHLTFSDKVEVYTPEKLEVLRRILPPIHGPGTRPGSLYSMADPPALWSLEVERPFDRWLVVANSTVGDAASEVHFSDIGLDPARVYAVYDFWQGEYCGIFRESFPCGKPGAGETQVFSFREVRDHPWVISTNRHISQGGVDLLDVTWDSASLVLAGTSQVVESDRYRIALHVPDGFRIAGAQCADQAMDMKTRDGFAELAITPTRTGTVGWQIRFDAAEVALNERPSNPRKDH